METQSSTVAGESPCDYDAGWRLWCGTACLCFLLTSIRQKIQGKKRETVSYNQLDPYQICAIPTPNVFQQSSGKVETCHRDFQEGGLD